MLPSLARGRSWVPLWAVLVLHLGAATLPGQVGEGFDLLAGSLVRELGRLDPKDCSARLEMLAATGDPRALEVLLKGRDALLARMRRLDPRHRRQQAKVTRLTEKILALQQKQLLGFVDALKAKSVGEARRIQRRRVKLQNQVKTETARQRNESVKLAAISAEIDALDEVVASMDEYLVTLHESANEAAKQVITAAVCEKLRGPLGSVGARDRIRLLGTLRDPTVSATLVEVAGETERREALLSVLDALVHQRDEPARIAAERALDHTDWEVRLVAIRILEAEGSDRAVKSLIDALEGTEGRLSTELVAALLRMTGHCFYYNHELWLDWWARFQAGDEERRKPDEAELEKLLGKGGGGTSFYGLETRSKHLVFVIDISGSMTLKGGIGASAGTPRVERAMQELSRSLTGLPTDGSFGLVVYNHEVKALATSLRRSSARRRQSALKWARDVEVTGATNIHDALEKAFQIASRPAPGAQRADTIFLLSDGVANSGRYVDDLAVLRSIRGLNRDRKIALYVIGIGDEISEELLKRLAQESGGRYLRRS